MTNIRLHNARTRRKEEFAPLDLSNVRMYVCGPTVYDRAHLGNARPVVVFDVLFRLLRHVYGAEHVTYVRNFTDVDDKINARSVETGRPIREITDETIRWYHEDMDALGALRPTHEPRATEWVGAMIGMIETLIARGHAYEAEGHVLFRVRSYPEYGQLSGRSLDDMIAGARVEVAPYKEDPLDFVLWKPSTPDLPGWDSPWGRGRPGWHIECSAMAGELLGPAFDIHGGGSDLLFPHHENEVAQSACAHPGAGFARVWMHNEMLLVEGKKMSKSDGNFFTVRDLLDQGVPGEVIRFVLLGTHYSKPMDWTRDKQREADETLYKWEEVTRDIQASSVVSPELIAALSDDLDTSRAIGILHKLYDTRNFSALAAGLSILMLNTYSPGTEPQLVTPPWLLEKRQTLLEQTFRMYVRAKEANNFSAVDSLKAVLRSSGIQLSFTTHETTFGSIDLEKARNFVLDTIPSWPERMNVFGSAAAQVSRHEYRLERRAVAYYYATSRLEEALLTVGAH